MEFNQIRQDIATLSLKIRYLEEAAKGSLSTREERAGSAASFRERLVSLSDRVGKLEEADKELGSRFAQVWIGVFLAFLGLVFEHFRR